MKKFGIIPIIVIILTALLSAGLHDYTTQEVFNLVLVDSAGTRLATTLYDYTTQEALNTVFDPTTNTLLVRVENLDDLQPRGTGTGYWFTTDDYIEWADDIDLDVGTADFSISIKDLRLEDVSGDKYLINKEDGGIGYGLYITDDDLYIRFDDNTADASAIIGTACFEIDTYYDVTVTFDRDGNATAYVNGISVGTVDISGSPLTLSNGGVLRIGSTTAGADFLTGTIFGWKLFNRVLTSLEQINLYIGQGLAYEDLRASNTLVVPSDDCADDDTGNWTDVNGALTFDTDHYVYTVTTGASSASFWDEASLSLDKQYTATVLIKDGTGAGATARINAITNAGAVLQKGSDVTVAAGYAMASVTWIATETNNKVQIVIDAASVADGETVLFDEITTNSIGNNANFVSGNATPTTWYGAAGNSLDGAVSGAILLNYTEHSYANNAEVANTVWATTFDTNVAAAGLTLEGATLQADGTDTNIDIVILPKGTGVATVTGTTDYENNVTDDDDLPNKKYTDDLVTAQDLDTAGDTGTGSVDLDSQSLTVSGTASEIETVASNQSITIGLPATVAVTTKLSSATYGSDGTVTDAELLYINSLGSNAQDQLDVRCLESVFGTAIGTGLLLDGTTLKTHAALQSIAGLTEADVSILEGTADDTYGVVSSGGNNYILGSNAGNTALEFKTPANVLTQIGGQPLDAELTAIAGLTSAADKGIQFTGSETAAVYDLTTAGKALLDDTDNVAQLITLGLNATASEINTPLDGASVTLSEFQELETIGATTLSANQWALLGGLAETLGSAEVNILDGVTGVTSDELSYIGDVTSLLQAQLDARCLESVFGTSIGTGLLLDGAVLKAQLGLQSIAGLTETNGGILYGTADNAYAWLAAGTANYILQGNGAGAPSWTNSPVLDSVNATAMALTNLYIDTNNTWMKAKNYAGTWGNLIKWNASDNIEFGAPIQIDYWEFEEDAGVVTAMDMPVSSTPSDGDEMSYTFKIDTNNILKIKASANSSGGADEFQVVSYGGRIENITTVAAATYDLLADDYILNVTYTGTAAVTSLTLPTAQCVAGRVIIIKDAGGNANANNITVDTEGAETIDGGATSVINGDYDAINLFSDGTNWYIF